MTGKIGQGGDSPQFDKIPEKKQPLPKESVTAGGHRINQPQQKRQLPSIPTSSPVTQNKPKATNVTKPEPKIEEATSPILKHRQERLPALDKLEKLLAEATSQQKANFGKKAEDLKNKNFTLVKTAEDQIPLDKRNTQVIPQAPTSPLKKPITKTSTPSSQAKEIPKQTILEKTNQIKQQNLSRIPPPVNRETKPITAIKATIVAPKNLDIAGKFSSPNIRANKEEIKTQANSHIASKTENPEAKSPIAGKREVVTQTNAGQSEVKGRRFVDDNAPFREFEKLHDELSTKEFIKAERRTRGYLRGKQEKEFETKLKEFLNSQATLNYKENVKRVFSKIENALRRGFTYYKDNDYKDQSVKSLYQKFKELDYVQNFVKYDPDLREQIGRIDSIRI